MQVAKEKERQMPDKR